MCTCDPKYATIRVICALSWDAMHYEGSQYGKVGQQEMLSLLDSLRHLYFHVAKTIPLALLGSFEVSNEDGYWASITISAEEMSMTVSINHRDVISQVDSLAGDLSNVVLPDLDDDMVFDFLMTTATE